MVMFSMHACRCVYVCFYVDVSSFVSSFEKTVVYPKFNKASTQAAGELRLDAEKTACAQVPSKTLDRLCGDGSLRSSDSGPTRRSWGLWRASVSTAAGGGQRFSPGTSFEQ